MSVNRVGRKPWALQDGLGSTQRPVPEHLLAFTSLLGLLLLCWVAFGWQLGDIGLIDETEPLFAEAARQMLRTGDFITPYFNGVTRFDKPPLIYWGMALAYQLVGVNEWGVRLPSALAGTGLTLGVFWTLRTFTGSWRAAWVGAVVTALSPMALAWGRIGVSDMLLCACIGATMLSFFVGYVRQSRLAYLSLYAWMSLGILTKGPVAIVLPALAIALFLALVGQWRQVRSELHLLQGSLIVLLLALPWYLAVTAINGEAFIDKFFGYHNIDRFVSVVNRHQAPLYFYIPVILIGFLPWSPFLPLAIARLRFWRLGEWRTQPRSEHLGLYALCWFGVVLVFFTVSVTKLPSYMLPLIPAIALLLGLLWRDETSLKSRGFQISAFAAVGVYALLAVLSWHSLNWLPPDPWMPNLQKELAQQNLNLTAALIWAGIAVLGVLAVLWRQGRFWFPMGCSLGFAALIALVILPTLTTLDLQRQLPLRQLAVVIEDYQQMHPEQASDLIVLGPVVKPSVVFYAKRNARFLQISKQLRARYLNRPHPDLLVLGSEKDLRLSRLRPDEYEPLATAGYYRLVRVYAPQAKER
ncbi:glycosyltransferase family 39 protein [Leptolyngbya sp. FACHB-261]|uniref:ArnT family glycosyltransferase n=1 Tax=Leptolyngbya sp. FACHB-261 TaxID=2692806 RepID=UPI0016847370|nr:glycosyltransferase family 39 protein [Leptolyngbya sp. FACHB-261]MBD2102158.1 glycosyltransferase family 39 protein [Leptolyngbya sp. FACHB-261]